MTTTTRGGFDGSGLDDESIEAILTGVALPCGGHADLVDAVTELRGVAAGPAPTPSAALVELLTSGPASADVSTDEVARRRRRRAAGVAVTLAAVATFTVSGVAAAHDALPGPIEHVVTKIVNNGTPFTIEVPQRSPSRVTPTTPRSTPTEPSGRHGTPGTGPSQESGEPRRDGSGRSGDPGDDGGRRGSGSDDRSPKTGDGRSGRSSKSVADSGSGSGKTGGSGETGGSGKSVETGGSGGRGSGGGASDSGSGGARH